MRTDLRVTQELADAVRGCVETNQLTQVEIAARGRMSVKTLRKLMTDIGEPVASMSLNRLDAALGWRVGTGYRLAAGLPVEQEAMRDGNTAAKILPVYGIGPETGRLIYRTAAQADDIEVTVDAAPGDHVDMDELVARMEEIAQDTARVMLLMRQAARDAHTEFNHDGDRHDVGRDR